MFDLYERMLPFMIGFQDDSPYLIPNLSLSSLIL